MSDANKPVSKNPINEIDIIYMVMTDRFCDGDPNNNGTLGQEYRPGDFNYRQGGDWKGLTQKIPFLKDLGITAIWMSPPQKNQLLNLYGTQAGYHGYNICDFYSADPHFGTLQELQELIDTAHAAGIKMIIDAVPNHTADYLAPDATSYTSANWQPAPPFNDPSWYHHEGDITDYNDPEQILNHDLGGLDDLNQDNPAVEQELYKVYGKWLDMGFDGIRVDADEELPKWFIRKFESNAMLPSFGEVFNGSVDFVSDYQNYQWGVLDFPLFFAMRSAFAEGPDIDFSGVKNIFDQDFKYKDPNKLVTFMDNHDRDRFLSWASDNYEKAMNALTFLFASRGLPDIYYGTDQALGNKDGIISEGGILDQYNLLADGSTGSVSGISDQYNRLMMPSFDESQPIYIHIQRLCAIRKDYPVLSYGTQREVYFKGNIYGFSRLNEQNGEEVIALFNNSWDDTNIEVSILEQSKIQEGAVLRDLLNPVYEVVVGSGGITGKINEVTIPAQGAVLLVSGDVKEYQVPQLVKTTIRVDYNSGYGNFLSVRGSKYPLWWNKGRYMHNIDASIWEYTIYRLAQNEEIEFKIMLNDKNYSQGNNYRVKGGTTITVVPNF